MYSCGCVVCACACVRVCVDFAVDFSSGGCASRKLSTPGVAGETRAARRPTGCPHFARLGARLSGVLCAVSHVVAGLCVLC